MDLKSPNEFPVSRVAFMPDHEKPGSFYLGRLFDLAAGELASDKVLYDANDLTTHVVCVGMTGSGKTGLCLSLIEEAALDGIPVIAIDPKGDLGNLLLAFPDLLPQDFEPWVDPIVAAQQGITTEQLAEQTAALWKKGLTEWDEDGERIRRFNSAVEKVIYTPGSTAGVPLNVLKSFHAPPAELIDDTETFNDLVQSTVQGVLALVGITANPVQSREAILIANVLNHSWRAGRDLDLPGLIRDIQRPPFSKVGIVDLENFLPAKERMELGMKINNLLASPSFANWLEGESLDVESLLYTADKKPRLSILSIAHLDDAERMFVVTIVLNEVLSWMRSQPGTGSLRAILYMDEVFGYFPPSANPPSKRPMLTLLKQARAFGLGVVLATQNPVDLDYKGLSNAGTWFLGRLQTERDKLRVLDGLEGISARAGGNFSRSQMDAILSGLQNRVFLMNNVHDSGPQLMHTRWAMSYLRGPLTREQIRTLMKGHRECAKARGSSDESLAEKTVADQSRVRPMLSGNIAEKFWPTKLPLPKGSKIEYRPSLIADLKLMAPGDQETSPRLAVRQDIFDSLPQPLWNSPSIFTQTVKYAVEPHPGGEFAVLPSPLTQEKNYRTWKSELQVWFQKKQRAAKDLDIQMQKTKDSIAKSELELGEHKWWWFSGFWNVLWRGIEIAFVRLMGGRSRKQLVTANSTHQMSRGRRRYAEAKSELAVLTRKLEELESSKQQLVAWVSTWQAESAIRQEIEAALNKSDIVVGLVELVWLPWQIDADGRTQPLY
jgi:hypothetical protein